MSAQASGKARPGKPRGYDDVPRLPSLPSPHPFLIACPTSVQRQTCDHWESESCGASPARLCTSTASDNHRDAQARAGHIMRGALATTLPDNPPGRTMQTSMHFHVLVAGKSSPMRRLGPTRRFGPRSQLRKKKSKRRVSQWKVSTSNAQGLGFTCDTGY